MVDAEKLATLQKSLISLPPSLHMTVPHDVHLAPACKPDAATGSEPGAAAVRHTCSRVSCSGVPGRTVKVRAPLRCIVSSINRLVRSSSHQASFSPSTMLVLPACNGQKFGGIVLRLEHQKVALSDNMTSASTPDRVP